MSNQLYGKSKLEIIKVLKSSNLKYREIKSDALLVSLNEIGDLNSLELAKDYNVLTRLYSPGDFAPSMAEIEAGTKEKIERLNANINEFKVLIIVSKDRPQEESFFTLREKGGIYNFDIMQKNRLTQLSDYFDSTNNINNDNNTNGMRTIGVLALFAMAFFAINTMPAFVAVGINIVHDVNFMIYGSIMIGLYVFLEIMIFTYLFYKMGNITTKQKITNQNYNKLMKTKKTKYNILYAISVMMPFLFSIPIFFSSQHLLKIQTANTAQEIVNKLGMPMNGWNAVSSESSRNLKVLSKVFYVDVSNQNIKCSERDNVDKKEYGYLCKIKVERSLNSQ